MTQSQRQRADRSYLNGGVSVVHGRHEYLRPDEVGLRPQLVLARGLQDWRPRDGRGIESRGRGRQKNVDQDEEN